MGKVSGDNFEDANLHITKFLSSSIRHKKII